MGKTIFLYSMFTFREYSKGITNTNSHIFDWLKKRNDIEKIYFIDFNRVGCIGKIKYFIKGKLSGQIKLFTLRYQIKKVDNKIFHYSGISYSGISKIIKKNKLIDIEIWSFNPLDISFLKIIPAIKIFYTIDDWRKNKLFKKYAKKLTNNYNIISKSVNYIFINNKTLKDKIFRSSSNTYFMPNGVNIKHFKSVNKISKSTIKKINNKVKKNAKPIVGYMGVITPDRVDFNLLEYCIKNNQDKDFVIAGPVWNGFNSKILEKKYNNIKFIGMVYYEELPYLFSLYNVCIIPHLTNEFIKSMDPKKIYEYLASGKPVVTTSVSGTENFSEIMYIARSNEEFSNKISIALKENSEEKISERQNSIIPHDWSLRFSKISKIINL